MSFQHHKAASPRDPFETEQKSLRERFADQVFLGSERRYPAGKAGADDEGELAYAMATDKEHGVIVIRFPKAVEWIGLGVKEAEELRDSLTARLLELRGITS